MEQYDMFGENGRAFQQYLRQSSSASGSIPSSSMLDQIIKSELARAYQHNLAGQEIQLNRQRLAEHQREFGLETDQYNSNRMVQSATGLLGTAAQLGTMYSLGPEYFKDRVYRKTAGDIYNIGVTP
jgi:hypothetical protein